MKVAGAALAWCSLTRLVSAATAPVPDGPVIELPPMIVAESSQVPWLYVDAGHTEYLSRCSPAITRAFITSQLQANQLLGVIIPAAFMVKLDTPGVSLLSPLELKQAGGDAVFQEMLRVEQQLEKRSEPKAAGELRIPRVDRYRFLPNMRLDDRDTSAVFTYIDERNFDGERLVPADDYVHFLLSRRTPMVPPWLIEGIVSVYRQLDLRREPITLQPLAWIAPDDRLALQRDPEARRVLLPAGEFFAQDVFKGDGNRHPDRIATWQAQAALFFRWALDPQHTPARDALWKFAERACLQPVTERWFVECFGFGYSDLRDRLSDYLPIAVKEPVRIRPGKLPALPPLEIKRATPEQSSRLRGEWERLEIPFVRKRHPQFLDRYVEQARRTLRHAYARGDRDPRLIGALGLCELEAAQPEIAIPILEQAMAGGIGRPRVYYEVARLRWESITRDVPENRIVPLADLAPVLTPLRRALTMAPPLADAYLLFADAWLRSGAVPDESDLALLARVPVLFVRIPWLNFRVAVLQARAGRRADAAAVLATSIAFVGDDDVRKRFEQLQRTLVAQPQE